jgi:dolichol-phosphate mannosyltransferase
MSLPPLLSVVVPVYNEAENLHPLCARLLPVLERIAGEAYEVLFVDDGSRDESAAIVAELNRGNPRLRGVHLSRNFGHQAALQAGLDRATGRAIVLMDADLQDPPELLPELVQRWREGFDVVYAVRRTRRERAWKRLAYHVFYRLLKAMSAIDAPVDAGDFCLMDARVVQTIATMPEQHRFLRGLRAWVGFRQTGVEYDRPARLAGEPKYTFRKLVNLALAGYVGFSTLPLRAAAWLGFACASAGFALAGFSIVARLTRPGVPQGWASTIAVILFIGGLQLIILGVIGEYLGRVYDEVRRRPSYIVRVESPGAGTTSARD